VSLLLPPVPPHEQAVDFPTLFIVPDWVEQHCVIPDGFSKGERFTLVDWQARFFAHYYRVKPDAEYGQLATAFEYRRAQLVMAQKAGKGPMTAAQTCAEGVGPVLFAGWARGGESYACEAHGCPCGWEYVYEAGEPMGMPWPTPLIQITAFSEEQTGNIYDALRPMITDGPLSDIIPKVGEEFTRLPNGGRIDTVTSSAQSRLGQRVTFVAQDETGIWTETNKMIKVAETQRRGLAGMGGRSCETTNPWDPAEDSVGQRTYESKVQDVLKWFPQPPGHLNYLNKEDRRRIHRFNYAGSPWVDLDAIEGEAAELLEKDAAQAERFFGMRVVAGTGSWCEQHKWDARVAPRPALFPYRTQIVIGFDGSDSDDWTALRAETREGFQFTPTYGPDRLPTIWNPADYGGKVPRLEVDAAVTELFEWFDVVRMYVDPPYWESETDAWSERYDDKKVIRFETYRPVQMFAACERLLTDVIKVDSGFSHDGCEITAAHVRNARKAARPSERYALTKPGVNSQKIDAAVASVICHEAHGDATKAQLWKKKYYAHV
jgi:hypothetical protein